MEHTEGSLAKPLLGQSKGGGPWGRKRGAARVLHPRPLHLRTHVQAPLLPLPLLLLLLTPLLGGIIVQRCAAQQVLGMALQFEAQERAILREATSGSPIPLHTHTGPTHPASFDGQGQAPPQGYTGLGTSNFDLEQYVRFPYDDGTCGSAQGWARAYQEMHRRMRAGEIERKYISFPWPPGGLGDQLVGIVTTFITGLLLNRSIILREPRLEAAFEPAEVDWAYRPDVVWGPIRHCQYNACREANASISAEEGKSYALLVELKSRPPPDEHRSNVKYPTDIFDFFRNLTNYQNLKIMANGGIITKIFGSNSPEEEVLSRMGLNLNNTFPCVVRYLLRPKKEVMELAAPLMAQLPGPPAQRLCLHLRSLDRMDEKGDGEKSEMFRWTQEHMLGCALNVSNYFLPLKSYWVLVADSVFLKERLKQWVQDYPNIELFESDIKPAHVQDGGEVTSAAEWLMFSTCKVYVVPQSGFSKTSLSYNMRSPISFIVPRMDSLKMARIRPSYEGVCQLDKPSGLEHLMELTGL